MGFFLGAFLHVFNWSNKQNHLEVKKNKNNQTTESLLNPVVFREKPLPLLSAADVC